MSATHSHFPFHSPTNSQFLLCCALHIVLTSRALMHYVGGVDSITPRTATMFRCTERHMHHWYQDTHPWHVTTQSPSLFLSKNRLLLDGQLQLHFAHPARNSDVFTYRFITHPHKYVISVHSTSLTHSRTLTTHPLHLASQITPNYTCTPPVCWWGGSEDNYKLPHAVCQTRGHTLLSKWAVHDLSPIPPLVPKR